jgi:hypothetical protein
VPKNALGAEIKHKTPFACKKRLMVTGNLNGVTGQALCTEKTTGNCLGERFTWIPAYSVNIFCCARGPE